MCVKGTTHMREGDIMGYAFSGSSPRGTCHLGKLQLNFILTSVKVKLNPRASCASSPRFALRVPFAQTVCFAHASRKFRAFRAPFAHTCVLRTSARLVRASRTRFTLASASRTSASWGCTALRTCASRAFARFDSSRSLGLGLLRERNNSVRAERTGRAQGEHRGGHQGKHLGAPGEALGHMHLLE